MNRQEQITRAAKAYIKDITTDIPATLQVMFIKGAEWADAHQNHWHDAQGDDLPEIDREVIVLLDNGKVCFAHRPVKSYLTVSIINHSEVEEYYPKMYDKGGWNIPNVKWWLDVALPKGGGDK